MITVQYVKIGIVRVAGIRIGSGSTLVIEDDRELWRLANREASYRPEV